MQRRAYELGSNRNDFITINTSKTAMKRTYNSCLSGLILLKKSYALMQSNAYLRLFR